MRIPCRETDRSCETCFRGRRAGGCVKLHHKAMCLASQGIPAVGSGTSTRCFRWRHFPVKSVVLAGRLDRLRVVAWSCQSRGSRRPRRRCPRGSRPLRRSGTPPGRRNRPTCPRRKLLFALHLYRLSPRRDRRACCPPMPLRTGGFKLRLAYGLSFLGLHFLRPLLRRGARALKNLTPDFGFSPTKRRLVFRVRFSNPPFVVFGYKMFLPGGWASSAAAPSRRASTGCGHASRRRSRRPSDARRFRGSRPSAGCC